MKGSVIVIAFFALGLFVGAMGWCPEYMDASALANYALYLLLAVVGFEFGSKGLGKAIRMISARILLLPVATIVGTLLFTALAGLILGGYSLRDYMAIGSGMGYYSLSSMIIIDIKEASVGSQIAMELATLALLANVLREILALVSAPLLRPLGRLVPISAAGVTSMDVLLPAIMRVCGQDMVPVAILHGAVIEVSVPVLVTAFCI